MTIKIINLLAVWAGAGLLMASKSAWAQLPNAPSATPITPVRASTTWHVEPNESYLVHVGALCGAGASTSVSGTKPMFACGVGLSMPPYPIFVELGVLGPLTNGSYLDGYVSVDGSIPFRNGKSRYLPMAILGYSRLFVTGNAFDYGLALAMPHFGKHKDDGGSLRLELRDYWTFANPYQHNVMLRLGWMGVETD